MRIILGIYLCILVGCGTETPPRKHCDQVMQEKTHALESAGFVVVTRSDVIRPDGVMLFGEFLNAQKEEGVITAVVDTEALAWMLLIQSFKEEGICSRGGKEWFSFSKQKKIETKTTQETSAS
jgi:hypothetical protein